MNDVTVASLSELTPGDAAVLEANAQLKLAEARCSEAPLAAATLQAEAVGLQSLAQQLRDPSLAGLPELRLGRGGEMSPAPHPRMSLTMRDVSRAVQSPPDMLGAEASMNRLSLARGAGVLTEAVHAAESVAAEGTIELMLVHEITAAHRVSMRLMAAANTAIDIYERDRLTKGDGSALLEANRTALATARLMDSVTRSAAALDRLRNGGRQQVTVQHVMVTDGGQALVAGSIVPADAGMPRSGRGQGRGTL